MPEVSPFMAAHNVIPHDRSCNDKLSAANRNVKGPIPMENDAMLQRNNKTETYGDTVVPTANAASKTNNHRD